MGTRVNHYTSWDFCAFLFSTFGLGASYLEEQCKERGYHDYDYLLTLAFVYRDNGFKDKANELFNNHVVPWIFIDADEKTQKYAKVYQKQ